jgi:hypothetical protein
MCLCSRRDEDVRGLMAHKKRIRCCRSTPRCADCPVLALQADRKAAKESRKRGSRKRPR